MKHIKMGLLLVYYVGQLLVCPAYAQPLVGHIANETGYIGVRCSLGGYIHKVFPHAAGLLNIGDTIISADGVKGINEINQNGCGTIVRLEVKDSAGNIRIVEIERVSKKEAFR